ncbi:hypothetical protein ACSQ67_021596 [Phaseolus vulgaris]
MRFSESFFSSFIRCYSGFERFLRLQFGGRLRLQSGLAFGVHAIWGLLLSSSVMEWSSVEENELVVPFGFSLVVYAWRK